jgi:hypothetical protein
MAISDGFWPLNLSVESLVLREMVPAVSRISAQSLHSPFRLQRGRVRLHLFLAGSRGVLSFFLAFEGPIWGFCYEIIIWEGMIVMPHTTLFVLL